jgi:putative ABC transport system ATP-binding protein
MATFASAVAVRNVTKTYAQGEAAMRALDGVDLDVARGELVLLMGPSGSGKTTLLSVMGCILRPTSGSVRVLGREVATLPERELPRVRLDHIGFVFQGFNLFPTLTAQANVALALDLKGVARRDAMRRAGALLEQVGLGVKLEAYPADLSGGQKQRVAIAAAFLARPRVVICDEITSGQDVSVQAAILETLRDLQQTSGTSVVLISHDLGVVRSMSDDVVVMQAGRVVEAGPTERVFTAPREEYTRSLLAAIPRIETAP